MPYRSIRSRIVLRRRLIGAALCLALVAPYGIARHTTRTRPMSVRVLDDVATTVGLRYYDRVYNGVPWHRRVELYRAQSFDTATEADRYSLLRRMLAPLKDSHTVIYSPAQLRRLAEQPPDDALTWKIAAPRVAYLHIRGFPDRFDLVLRSAFGDLGSAPMMILDLRHNGGGTVDTVDAVAGIFLPAGTLVATGTRRYHYRWFGSSIFRATDEAGVSYGGKLVVLTDPTTQSGAETLARALQFYHRGLIVGTRTAGKVLGVDVQERLPDGGLLRVATLDMRAADGARLEGGGVQPDVVVADPRAQVRTAVNLLKR